MHIFTSLFYTNAALVLITIAENMRQILLLYICAKALVECFLLTRILFLIYSKFVLSSSYLHRHEKIHIAEFTVSLFMSFDSSVVHFLF